MSNKFIVDHENVSDSSLWAAGDAVPLVATRVTLQPMIVATPVLTICRTVKRLQGFNIIWIGSFDEQMM